MRAAITERALPSVKLALHAAASARCVADILFLYPCKSFVFDVGLGFSSVVIFNSTEAVKGHY